jgi:hypothetical protein
MVRRGGPHGRASGAHSRPLGIDAHGGRGDPPRVPRNLAGGRPGHPERSVPRRHPSPGRDPGPSDLLPRSDSRVYGQSGPSRGHRGDRPGLHARGRDPARRGRNRPRTAEVLGSRPRASIGPRPVPQGDPEPRRTAQRKNSWNRAVRKRRSRFASRRRLRLVVRASRWTSRGQTARFAGT